MADFDRSIDLDKGLNRILDKIDSVAERIQNKGRETGESFGIGWDDGIDDTIEKIKASSIKTEKAFSNLNEKIRKQVQQLNATLNGKDMKVKVDFSDIDMNSEDVKKRMDKILKDFSSIDLIEFDTKDSEKQFKNLISLYVKYQAKLQSLQQVSPTLSNSDDMIKNLQQQLALSTKLKEIWSFFNGAWPLNQFGNAAKIRSELEMLQRLTGQMHSDKPQSFGEYDELAEVLKEIQGSLKVISDVFQNEKNSMKEMADSGKTSFESLSQAIVGAYDNLTKVQEIVNAISQKDFSVTNVFNQKATSSMSNAAQLDAYREKSIALLNIVQKLLTLNNELSHSDPKLWMSGLTGSGVDIQDFFNTLQKFDFANISGKISGAESVPQLKSIVGSLDVYKDKMLSVMEQLNKISPNLVDLSFLSQLDEIDERIKTAQSGVLSLSQSQSAKPSTDDNKVAIEDSVEAGKTKLQELVVVMTDEVGKTLDDIKEKFAQSFVVPELDKNQLQATFDEIYNKFVELKDKIGAMKIDVGVNTDNLTTAIQQALYAKEIEKNYQKITFEDVFEEDIFAIFEDNQKFKNLLTGNIIEGLDEAQAEFDEHYKGKWKDKNSSFQRDFLTTQQMLDRIVHRANVDAPKQDNWAQVIVEAINTQGGNIVEAIKVVLPKALSGDISDGDTSIDEAKLSNAFNTLSQAIMSWSNQTGKSSGAFFRSLQANRRDLVDIHSLGNGVEEALRTLGLITDLGKSNFIMPDTGMRNLGVVIADQIVGNIQESDNIKNINALQEKLNQASQLGASVPRILSLQQGMLANGTDAIFQLQTRVPGENIHSRTAGKDFLEASPEQIDRLLHTFETLEKVGLFPDFIGDNILFDKQKGFSLVDLDTKPLMGVKDADDMVNAFIRSVHNTGIPSDDFNYFSKKVRGRFSLSPEERLVNADTIAAEQAARTNKTEAKSNSIKLTPTMDEGAVAKVVADNVAQTPVTVKVSPVIDDKNSVLQSINGASPSVHSSSASTNMKEMVDAYVKWAQDSLGDDSARPLKTRRELFEKYPLLKDFRDSKSMSDDEIGQPDFDSSILVKEFEDFINLRQQMLASVTQTEQAVDIESQSAVDAAKSFVEAANAKKQFVEANKQVAEGAKESAKAVKEEAKAAEQAKQTMTALADDTIQPSNWDRVTQLQTDHGEDPFALSRSKTDNVGDKSVRTIVESWTAIRDEDGALTGDMELNTVKIINDFKKRTDAITKENEKIKTAQAYLQKFLTQFNNKTMGKGSLLAGYQDLANLANSSDFKIDDIARAEQMMSNLDAEYNKVVQSMRKGSASMNPFVNAINSMDKMEDVLLNISLQFRTLNEQPEWLKNQIIDLYKQLDNVSAETDIYKFAEGFGNLRVSINSVTESIRQQRLEQKLTLSDFNSLIKAIKARDDNNVRAAKQEKGSDWEKYYSDRATEQQKIVDAIRIGLTLTNEQEAQLDAMSEKHALILKDINLKNNKIEEQKQKYEDIIRLLEKNRADQIGLDNGSLKVIDKEAYQQRLIAERAQIDALIKGADLNPEQTKSVKDLVDLIATLKLESSNIDLMSKKWAEQNLLTDEARAKIESLKQALLALTSGSELSLWKKQWKELANEMSMANIDAKEDKQIGKMLEDDRKAQVKEYIDLLKIMYDYRQRAAKEDPGSDMQTFYNDQVAKVKERIDKIDIKSLENQDEKNKRLALEEAQQRAIAEILEKRNAREQRSIMLSDEDEKIQKKYESGYLSKDSRDDWETALVEYRNYMKGITQADQTTIQEKKKNLMQLYDALTKMSNANKSFFASGGEMLPQDIWPDKAQLNDVSGSLQSLYQKISTERFVGMKTAVTGVNEQLGKLNFTVDDGQGSLTQYTIAVNGATGATKLLQNTTKPTLTVLQKFGQSLKKDFTGLLHAIAGGSGIYAFVRYMREGVQSVRELDLALTELKKVTDETEKTYDRFLETAQQTGARIGRTITDVTSATAEFAKLGYSIEMASSMAEAALVYANVGDNVDVETGSQSIISTLKAFGIEADNTMSIVDAFNEVGNNFAITTKGIGDALQVSASAMAAAGNSMHESIGLITAAM